MSCGNDVVDCGNLALRLWRASIAIGMGPSTQTAGIRFLDTLAALLLPFRYTICHCSPCRAGCAALVLPMRKPS